jgi:uncharacterized membrane protein (DUF106 family)
VEKGKETGQRGEGSGSGGCEFEMMKMALLLLMPIIYVWIIITPTYIFLRGIMSGLDLYKICVLYVHSCGGNVHVRSMESSFWNITTS